MDGTRPAPMAGSPEVSVVIPTRNRWTLLSMAVGAALRQEGVDVEVIVVDDGSTDETRARLSAMSETRLRVLRHEASQGVATARNHGISEARGEWVAFLDDDDLWSPWKLRVQLDAAASQDAAWVYAGAAILDEGRNVVDLAFPPDPSELVRGLLASDVVPGGCSNAITRIDLVRRLRGFDPRLHVLADWDLWLRLATTARAAMCPRLLVGYLEHSSNMSFVDLDGVMSEFDYFATKHQALASKYGVGPDRASFARWIASGHSRAGRRFQAARACFSPALRGGTRGSIRETVRVLLGGQIVDRAHPEVSSRVVAELGWLENYRQGGLSALA
jgi:hypothetical protein